jgi:Domain of Unknown Function (DUF928)
MKLTLVIASVLLAIASVGSVTMAQIEPTSEKPATKQDRLPPGRGPAPGDTDRAGTRSACGKAGLPLTPVLPSTEKGFSGYTLTGYPTFWFYLPDTAQTANEGRFSIEDEQGHSVWNVEFQMPDTPGFVKFALPPTEAPLDKNKLYRWHIVVFCNSQDVSPSGMIFQTGVVRRIDNPVSERQINEATEEEKLSLFAARGIWYDATANLDEFRRSPAIWPQFLRTIGLEQLTNGAIANPTIPELQKQKR